MWLLVAAGVQAREPEPPSGMEGHFQDAALLMLAVAVDDRKGARTHAKSLATSDLAPLPLRESARELLPDLGKAERSGPAVADLVGACATCHLVGGRGPTPSGIDAVPGDSPVERHLMASMFVWIGLVTPMEQPYLLGLDQLLTPIDLESDPGVRQAAETFATLVRNARAARSWADRRDKFGQLLPVCVECHERAGVTVR